MSETLYQHLLGTSLNAGPRDLLTARWRCHSCACASPTSLTASLGSYHGTRFFLPLFQIKGKSHGSSGHFEVSKKSWLSNSYLPIQRNASNFPCPLTTWQCLVTPAGCQPAWKKVVFDLSFPTLHCFSPPLTCSSWWPAPLGQCQTGKGVSPWDDLAWGPRLLSCSSSLSFRSTPSPLARAACFPPVVPSCRSGQTLLLQLTDPPHALEMQASLVPGMPAHTHPHPHLLHWTQLLCLEKRCECSPAQISPPLYSLGNQPASPAHSGFWRCVTRQCMTSPRLPEHTVSFGWLPASPCLDLR